MRSIGALVVLRPKSPNRAVAQRLLDYQATDPTEGLEELCSLAVALLGTNSPALWQHKWLPSKLPPVSPQVVRDTRRQIRAGLDPLGDAYCKLRNAEQRRPSGQTFTPSLAVDAMVAWASNQSANYVRIVDPGAGSGRFTFSALERFPGAHAVCVESDPRLALLLRANAACRGVSRRIAIVVDDFRNLDLPVVSGKTLFVGNPPYVRHHDISPSWKQWYSQRLQQLGHHSSQLAGLHLHFFLKTLELAREGDRACFITAAEWLDVNYGQALRDLLTNGLGGTAIFAIAPEIQIFDDALVSAAITCFAPGEHAKHVAFKLISRASDLKRLAGGRKVPRAEARASSRWSGLCASSAEAPNGADGLVPLGELFRVQRGQVTGANDVWVVPPGAPPLPTKFLVPCVTRAAELISLPTPRVTKIEGLRVVASLPKTLAGLAGADRKAVEAYIAWAEARGAHKGYIARHRSPWWRVDLKQPAPIVMTYMGRRPPVFALNAAQARLINVAHGLYPKLPLPVEYLRKLVDWLNTNVTIDQGRSYAGGLIKFEPSEVMRLRIPPVEQLLNEKSNARTRTSAALDRA